LTAKTAPSYTLPPSLDIAKRSFDRSIPAGLPSAPARPESPHLAPCSASTLLTQPPGKTDFRARRNTALFSAGKREKREKTRERRAVFLWWAGSHQPRSTFTKALWKGLRQSCGLMNDAPGRKCIWFVEGHRNRLRICVPSAWTVSSPSKNHGYGTNGILKFRIPPRGSNTSPT
jgi:hypothetical protein